MEHTEDVNKAAGAPSALNVGLGFVEKPPLGLMPRRNHEWATNQQRMTDIIEAMKRYNAVNKKLPQEWFDELSERLGVNA